MADIRGAGGIRFVKIVTAYIANANVPGVLMPYTADWLDLANGNATVFIEKNGVPLVTGTEKVAGVEVYPGTKPEEGDIKTVSGLAENDILIITYLNKPARYAEI